MKIIGLIPSRYASTRFHAKPLVDIKGKSMIQRVYEQVSKAQSVSKVVVATDHREIFDHVLAFGGDVCMTKESHVSGTDRCYEALKQQAEKFDYVINIQGDEPFIQPAQIDLLASKLNGVTEIATLVKALTTKEELLRKIETLINKVGAFSAGTEDFYDINKFMGSIQDLQDDDDRPMPGVKGRHG